MNTLSVGFLSTAGIARKSWKVIFDSGNCVVSAVCSRNAVKSREYIRQCQVGCAFDTTTEALGSYDALIASPDVDAVYVPLPTGLRGERVVRGTLN